MYYNDGGNSSNRVLKLKSVFQMATLCRLRFAAISASQSLSACISSRVSCASRSIVALNVLRRSRPPTTTGHVGSRGAVFSLSEVAVVVEGGGLEGREWDGLVGGGLGGEEGLGGDSEGKRKMSREG